MSNENQSSSSKTTGTESLYQDNCFTNCLSSSLPSSSSGGGQQQTSDGFHPIRYSFQKQPFVIGVAGGTASGKSTVCSKIIKRLGPIDPKSIYLSHEKRVVRISQDSFYRKLTDEDRQMVDKGMFNFDHPSAFDVDLMVRTLRDVCDGKMVRVPIYNYNENEISDKEEIIYPADVILFEGLLLFYFPELRQMFHMKIFVDTDPDTRLSRRVIRDVKERNRDLSLVLAQYLNFVKPSFEEFCLPTKKYADIVVPRGPDNEVAVNLIVTQIHSVVDPTIRHRTIKFGRLSLINDNGDEFKNSPKRKLLSSSSSSSSTLSSSSSSTLSSSMVEKQNSLINGSNIVNEEKGEKPINGILNKTTKSIPVQIRYPNNGGGVYTNGHHHHHHQACGLLADKIDDLYLSSSAPSYLNNGTIKFTTTNHKPLLMVNHDDNELKNDLAFHHHHQNHLRPSNQSSSSSSSSTISVSSTTTVTGVENTNNGQSAKILMIASLAIDFIVQTIRDLITNKIKFQKIMTTTTTTTNNNNNDNNSGSNSTPVSPVVNNNEQMTIKKSNHHHHHHHRHRNQSKPMEIIRTRHNSDSKEDISYNRLNPYE
ncbi:UMP-CMP kinase, variant 2 [Dermatophagoides farinae]|uniref:uridine/cytidine kinase n=1 Tax=Dermatophagoides farinae TaxID=6954 RepID=A0A922I8P2_DERFA|nr:UMP-CMP kinase, variant 2 [Dermatophagoides farinae]